MNYKITKPDELYHHGVKGMKWGVRNQRSVAGGLRRGLAGVYGMNERFYRKTGNKTLASMNAQARNQQLKKAAAADAKKQQKVENKRKTLDGKKAAENVVLNNAKVSYEKAKAKSNAARKAYNKSFNKAYGFSSAHPFSQYRKGSKNYNKSNDYWNDAIDKAGKYNKAHKEMRSAKKAYKQAKRNS